jgi:hypothetical protein
VCPASRSASDDDLPYIVEIWDEAPGENVERVLAKATTLKLARAILMSAQQEYPGRRITLRMGDRMIEDLGTGETAGSPERETDPAH